MRWWEMLGKERKIRFLGKIRIERAKGELRRILITLPRSVARMLGTEEELDGLEVFVTLEKR